MAFAVLLTATAVTCPLYSRTPEIPSSTNMKLLNRAQVMTHTQLCTPQVLALHRVKAHYITGFIANLAIAAKETNQIMTVSLVPVTTTVYDTT